MRCESRSWGHGYVTEAASSAVELLRKDAVARFTARISPGHDASERVAQKLGPHPTAQLVDGEVIWAMHDPTDV
ncbi:GNAT family N-acetyltransferase [Kocuria carniphila]|uniref:GNAT family N-acetyltransferase n=1 Tax=Kocuria carniphila TaxID=262208 RepID=UPI0028EA8714|nr:GNAT family N-acetyltransferase [Kocuria carniphila]